MAIWLTALMVVVIMAAVSWAYFSAATLLPAIAPADPSWGDFGVFFGGVVGPLFLLLVLFSLVHLVRRQTYYFEAMFQETQRLDMLRYLSKVDDEITRLLARDMKMKDERVAQFGDLIDGLEQPENLLDRTYQPAMEKLLKLTAGYCEAIDVFRSSVGDEMTLAIHQQRARDLLLYLEQYPEILNPMAKQSISYCKMHLDGRHPMSRDTQNIETRQVA